MIRLTNHPTRELVRSLWLVLSVGVGVVVGLGAAVLGLPLWTVWLAGSTLLASLIGVKRPSLAHAAYFFWHRITGGLDRRASAVLERTAFTLVWLVGRAGGDLRTARPDAATTGWLPRPTLDPEAYGGPGSLVDRTPRRRGWAADVWAWGRRTGNGWVWALLPILALMRQVEPQHKGFGPSTTTYTLY